MMQVEEGSMYKEVGVFESGSWGDYTIIFIGYASLAHVTSFEAVT